MLEKIKNYFTVERRLFLSVVVGWGFMLFFVIIPYILTYFSPQFADFFVIGVIITAIYLCIRYSTFGPVLQAAGGGLTAVAGISIIDYFLSRREEAGSLTMAAFVGVMLVIFFVMIWNTIKATYYLIRETITFIKHYDQIMSSIRQKSVA